MANNDFQHLLNERKAARMSTRIFTVDLFTRVTAEVIKSVANEKIHFHEGFVFSFSINPLVWFVQ